MSDEPESLEPPRPVTLVGRALRESLATLPGWRPTAGCRQLHQIWQFQSKTEASAFVVMVVALCFARRMLPDHSLFGTTVTFRLGDSEARGITARLVELARLISTLAEPAGNRWRLRPGIVERLAEEACEPSAGGTAPHPPPSNSIEEETKEP